MEQEKIGKFIKKIRTDNGLTQKDFADKLGVTYQAVSKWENGKNIPDIMILKQISKEFNVNIDDLLEGRSSKKGFNYKVLFVIFIVYFFMIMILILRLCLLLVMILILLVVFLIIRISLRYMYLV